jgi:glucan phosphoethanolaminetransferase (alkaline phosphatase superfamily)
MSGHGRYAIFSIVFGVAYTVAFYFNLALFKFYPLVGAFHMTDQGKEAGPPISWYGWLATALVVSLPVSLLTPRRLADRLSPSWAGLIPVALVVLVLIYEKRWFF